MRINTITYINRFIKNASQRTNFVGAGQSLKVNKEILKDQHKHFSPEQS